MYYFQVTCFVLICVNGPVLGYSKSIGSSDTAIASTAPEGTSELSQPNIIILPSYPFLSSSSQYPTTLGLETGYLPARPLNPIRTTRIKRTPSGFSARGFHEGAFDRDFGHFSPVKRTQKRKPEAGASGFYGDTFSNGFGDFETMKRDIPYMLEDDINQYVKRRQGSGASGFHGDTFSQGFGAFDTMRKRYNSLFDAVKRKPEMTKSGFHGDFLRDGFGEFHTM